MNPPFRASRLAFVLALVSSSVAQAQAAPAAMQRSSTFGWVRLPGAERCIGTQELAQRVEERLGRPVFVSASEGDLALEGRVERDEDHDRWTATLVMSDRRGRILGRRVLQAPGPDCSALDDSLTLVIAIAIDPGAATASGIGSGGALSPDAEKLLSQLELQDGQDKDLLDELVLPESQPETPAPANPPTEPNHRRAGERGPDRATAAEQADVRVALDLRGLIGPLPDPGPGLGLTLTFKLPEFVALELGFEGFLAQTLEARDAGTVRFRLLAGSVGVCPLMVAAGPFELRTCAGGRLGALLVTGENFARDRSPSGIWGEALLYGVTAWNFGDFFLQAGAALGVALVRDTFRFSDRSGVLQNLHRPDALSGRLWLGAGLRFR